MVNHPSLVVKNHSTQQRPKPAACATPLARGDAGPGVVVWDPDAPCGAGTAGERCGGSSAIATMVGWFV